ncbi:MAG TPA: hypothetical protein VLK84_12000 [Longimicrobium sp.]|nr:hypothetical protein [Longimicrobium sp.]
MISARSLCLASLLCLVGACGGDRTTEDAASGLQPGESSRPDSATAAAPTGSAAPGVPAFVTDSATAGDSTPASDSSAAVRSVYTSLAEADCRLVEQDEETGDTTSRCPGTAGYALLVHDWDARMSVDIVAPGGRKYPLRYSGVITSNFSSLGPRAEWRMRGGKPIALIVRLNAFEDPEVPSRATSYLAVARITDRETCVTDRIPPTTPNANEAAQRAADQSASRPCMRDIGEQG